MLRSVFVSTSIYALGKQLGIGPARDEFARQMHLDPPDRSCLPVAHTIHAIRGLIEGVQLLYEPGNAPIGHMRSRAFHEARERLDLTEGWICIDDDIKAPRETCAHVLDAIDDLQPRIVVVPYLLRTAGAVAPKLSLTMPKVRLVRTTGPERGTRLVQLPPKTGGGFGLVAMNRAAIEQIVIAFAGDPALRWVDEDGTVKLALFHEVLELGYWFGEDVSFFRRVPSSVNVEALVSGTITHDGITLDLAGL